MQALERGGGRLFNWLLVLLFILSAYSILNSYLLFVVQRYIETGYYIHALERVMLFVAGATALGVLFVAANRTLLSLAAIVVFLNGTVNFTFRSVAKDVLTTEKFAWLLSEIHQVGNATLEFAPQILWSGARVAAAIFLLLAARHFARKPAWNRLESTTQRSVGLLAIVPYITLAVALRVFDPDPIPWEHGASIAVANALLQEVPTPRPADMKPVGPGVEKILLVVDESVRADIFRNLFQERLKKLGGIEFRNTWTAVPCSGGSNAFLRWGINPTHPTDATNDPRTQPTIFGYAAVAGYNTFLFDAQTNGSLQNFMSASERALIKHYSAKEQGIDSDAITAKVINKVLREPGRDLIYFVKRGAHFPYERNLPVGAYDSHPAKAKLYGLAVEYSNDQFFKEIIRGVDRDHLLMLYTSDHGQRLSNEGLPHCNPTPRREELEVPLWIFPPRTLQTSVEQAALKGRGGDFSSLQIMPTLLLGMGFPAGTINKEYYRTLLDGPSRRWLLRSPYLPYPARKAGAVKFTEFQE